MKRRVNDYVKCPYYKFENDRMIYCEGPEELSTIHLAFASSKQRTDYEGRYCKNCWGKCLVAGAHNRKWNYQEE